VIWRKETWAKTVWKSPPLSSPPPTSLSHLETLSDALLSLDVLIRPFLVSFPPKQVWFDLASLSSPPWFEVCTGGYLFSSISLLAHFLYNSFTHPPFSQMDFFNLPCILSCLDIVSLWAYETVFLILPHPLYAPSAAHTGGQLCIPFYQLHNWFAESFSILIRDMSKQIPWAWLLSNRKWSTTKAMRIIYHLQGQIEATASKKMFKIMGLASPL